MTITRVALERLLRNGMAELSQGFIQSVELPSNLEVIPIALAKPFNFALKFDTFQILAFTSSARNEEQDALDCRKVIYQYRKAKKASGSKQVYYLFIAQHLSTSTLAYFFGLNQIHLEMYGGKANIIPLTLAQFQTLIERSKTAGISEPIQLEQLFIKILAAASENHGETAWQQFIDSEVARCF